MCFGRAPGAVAEDGEVGVVIVDLVVLSGPVGVSKEGNAEADVTVVGLRVVYCRRHLEPVCMMGEAPDMPWYSAELGTGSSGRAEAQSTIAKLPMRREHPEAKRWKRGRRLLCRRNVRFQKQAGWTYVSLRRSDGRQKAG